MIIADLQEALNAHNRRRKSTDKDTVLPNLFLDCIIRATTVAQWIRQSCGEILDDNPNINKGNWADIQREFLAAYAPRFTARTTCTNFQDLIQQNNENVLDYLSVSNTFKKMCEAKQAAIATVPIDCGAATVNQDAAIKLEGVKDSEGFFKKQLFIATLKKDIHMKIMEAIKPSIQESVTHARELEVIHKDRKKGSTVGNIAANEDNNDDLDNNERAAVDAVHLQRGKPLYPRPGQPPGNQSQQPRPANPCQGQQQPFSGQCRYCKIQGHHQKDCRKQKTAKAPMVHATGKPYSNQVASMQQPQQQNKIGN